MDLLEWLKITIDKNTPLFLILSAIIGAVIKFLFDKYVGYWLEEKRNIRKVVRKYKKPLLISAQSLERGINNNIRNFNEEWIKNSEYFKLNILYRFGEFLGWLKILEQETGFIRFNKTKDTQEFYTYVNRIYGSFTSLKYFLDYYSIEELKETEIKKGIRDALGEIMIKRDGDELTTIGFAEFVQNYKSDKEKFVWMDNLADFLAKAYENEIIHDRLILIEHYLQRFVWFLDDDEYEVSSSKRRFVNLEKIKEAELLKDLFEKLKSKSLDSHIKKEDKAIIKEKISNLESQSQ